MNGQAARCRRCGWQVDPDTTDIVNVSLIAEHTAEHDAADAEVAALAADLAADLAWFGAATVEELAAQLDTVDPAKAAAVRRRAELVGARA